MRRVVEHGRGQRRFHSVVLMYVQIHLAGGLGLTTRPIQFCPNIFVSCRGDGLSACVLQGGPPNPAGFRDPARVHDSPGDGV